MEKTNRCIVNCPTEEELSGLVTGTLDPAEIERLTAHLESCAQCEARVSALDQLSDVVMSGIRVRAGQEQRESDLRPGQVLGDYILGEELGSGGMARVFRATHARMRREVALKVVSRRGMRSQGAARRFMREVEMTAKLNHPNIAIAYDAREQDGIVYLILEYVGGTDLSRLVKEKGPLPINDAIDYVIQAARGLSYAHGRGIVHRDVKPANLMLDGEGVVKVLDLGLSRLREVADPPSMSGGSVAKPMDSVAGLAGEVTQAGDVLGTVDFVAPEQVHSPGDADHRADIYSLGCTLFYLLTGRSAFARGSTAATLEAHRNDPVPSLRKERPDVSARLEAAFAQSVAKRPQDRFATMNDVIKALRDCQMEGLARRRWVGAAAACVLLVAMGGWFWHWQNQRARALSGVSTTSAVRLARPPVPVFPFEPDVAVRHRDQWREYANAAAVMTNSIGMKFAFIPPGEFPGGGGQTIRITRPYYMGIHEITIGQFRAFVREMNYRTIADREGGIFDSPTGFVVRPGINWEKPGFAVTDDHPALQLSHTDVNAFARWLSQKEKRVYRVPTVAQWSWAAQAGTLAPGLWDDNEDAAAYGWNSPISGRAPHPVGQLKPNPWGLYDVRGNAAEWCADLRYEGPKPPWTQVLEDPAGAPVGSLRMIMGSTFSNDDVYTIPGNAGSSMRYPTWGGRLMCEIEGAPSIAAPPPAATTAAATNP
jgi:serine/threonine protein kinase